MASGFPNPKSPRGFGSSKGDFAVDCGAGAFRMKGSCGLALMSRSPVGVYFITNTVVLDSRTMVKGTSDRSPNHVVSHPGPA